MVALTEKEFLIVSALYGSVLDSNYGGGGVLTNYSHVYSQLHSAVWMQLEKWT